MPRRKRLSCNDRRRRVLSAATGLFARRGFQGAKTRHIAGKARINEALLFRDFPCKEDLYWAVLEEKCAAHPGKEIIRKQLDSGEDDLSIVTSLAEGILERNAKDPTLIRLWLFCGLESHRLARRFYRTHVAEFYGLFAGYIRRRIEAGVFRPVDPLIAAKAFLSMVIHHFIVHELLGGKQVHAFDPREVSKTIASIWLNGMLAQRNPS
jgi:AcrR family transcriptional regulator